ncbi:MAG: DUF1269 domain-containing protein [Acidimicrobiales bacterium]
MSEYVAAIVFPENSVTYQAYSTIKNTAGALGVESAAIVERDAYGRASVTEGDDASAGLATAGGSLIGMLIGVLGGPIGVLLGWTTGAAIGALVDADKLDKGDDVVSEFARLVPPGRNAIVAQTNEADSTALDATVAELGGTITRQPLTVVMSDLEAQQQAAEDAAKAARDAMKEQRKEQRHEKWEDRVDQLKSRFHHGSAGDA